MDKLTEKRYRLIDWAIHSDVEQITIGGKPYPVSSAKNGMRYITWDHKTFIQQDPTRKTGWGKKARDHKVTRVMRSGGKGTSWGLIVNGNVELE